MAVVVHEELMAAGRLSVDIDWAPEIHALLVDERGRPRKLAALVYNAENLLVCPPMVLLKVRGDEDGLTLGDLDALWYLGSNGIGPMIGDRSYFSGASKLSNGSFELGLDYWHLSEGSAWVETAGAVYHATGTDTDDPFPSDEVFPAAAGEEYTATCRVSRSSGAVGRLHLRLVFDGKFTPADILVHDWHNTSEFPGDMAEIAPGVLRVGPNERKQIVINGSFETGTLANWVAYSGTWGPTTTNPRTGAWSADIGGTPGFMQLVSDAVAGGVDQGYPVLPGETYVVGTFIQPGAGADGKAYIHVLLGGVVDDVPNTPMQQVKSIEIENNSVTAGAWNLVAVEVQVPPDAVLPYLSISLIREEQTTGNFYFDDVACIRTIGNRGYLAAGTAWFFVPLRTYVWSAKVSTAGLISGSMRFGMTLIGVGRPNIYIESQPFEVGSPDGMIEWAFTPPSGYEAGSAVIISDDLYGGYFTLSDMHCYDQDSSTVVVDTDSAAGGGWATLTRSFTAPVGTDSVHVEVIAEADADGWSVSDVTLTRTSVPLANGDIIVSELLAGTSVLPGYVTCPEYIPYDWRILNLTIRDALEHYCTVVSEPAREFRLNATDPPTINVATPEVLFIDHSPDSGLPITIVPSDVDVTDLADPETDVTDRPTVVRVIGANRTTVSGRPILITADAVVPGEVERDYNNNPMTGDLARTKIVSAGTVDHFGYARALAEDLAEREAEPALNLGLVLSGRDTRADLGVGDWIYVFHPEAGLQDTTYVDEVDGQTVFPRRVRVLARERNLGPSYHIVMRRPDGSTFPLPGVLWSDEDATVLTIGDRVPEWQSDPQGRTEGEQYLRDRASGPR